MGKIGRKTMLLMPLFFSILLGLSNAQFISLPSTASPFSSSYYFNNGFPQLVTPQETGVFNSQYYFNNGFPQLVTPQETGAFNAQYYFNNGFPQIVTPSETGAFQPAGYIGIAQSNPSAVNIQTNNQPTVSLSNLLNNLLSGLPAMFHLPSNLPNPPLPKLPSPLSSGLGFGG